MIHCDRVLFFLYSSAYAYALREKRVSSYKKFIENFITYKGKNTEQELIDFLYEEFGIEYQSDEEINIDLDDNEFQTLVNALSVRKQSEEKAKTDAKLVLSIYYLRKKNGEHRSSLEGYKTWWLSSDTVTHAAVSEVLGDKYKVSCYMRPDFLHNYINFTPTKESVEKVYRNTFPNLLGVQISNHVPSSISTHIRKQINEHGDQLDGRRRAKIRSLIDDIQTNPEIKYKDRLSSFFSKK